MISGVDIRICEVQDILLFKTLQFVFSSAYSCFIQFICTLNYITSILYIFRVYESDAYIKEHIAVFHASYIDECVHRNNLTRVAIGKYLLPNSNLQKGEANIFDPTRRQGSHAP